MPQAPTAYDPAAASPLHRVLTFGAQVYRNAGAQTQPGALARVVACCALRPAHADVSLRSVAVLGPTQVGKSTVVNLLLSQELAGVSPLAGYTTCPEGFLVRPGRQTVEPATDPPLPGPLRPARRPCDWPADGPWLIWDTPDFDTLSASQYRDKLLAVIASAGSFVVVLSAEKYADLTVWQMLEVLALLERPVLFVFNKLPEREAEAILAAFQAHTRQQIPRLAPAADAGLWLPLTDGARTPDAPDDPRVAATITQLRRRLAQTPVLEPARLKRDAARLIRAYWDAWTAPIRAEHAALRRFDQQLDHAVQRFVRRYRETFLDDPQRYDTLHRVTAELLTLLDVPYLARWLGQARFWLGLPARLIARQLRSRRKAPEQRAAGSEPLVLGELVDQLLVELTRFCLQQAQQPDDASALWRALARRLEQREPQLRSELETRIRQHDESFRHEIRAAAEALYARIRENPRLLHSLRAGRLGADVAGVIVALKTAGTGIGELLLTPAMLVLTQSLTEGALGAYMQRIAAQLKQRQLEHLERDFVEAVLRPKLARLARQLDDPDVSNISEEELAAAEDQIRELEAAR